MLTGGISGIGFTANRLALSIGDSLLASWNALASWLPNILGAFVVLLIGAYIAKLVRQVAKRVLAAVKFDQWVEKFGINKFLKTGGITVSISSIFLWLIYWLVALVFLNSAAKVLGIPEISTFVEELVGFIPRVFAGLVIMLIGIIAARAVGDMLGGVAEGKAYKMLANWVILLIAFVTAIEQLGFKVDFLAANLNIVLAGVMLAVGLAFGLGGKEKAKEMLERHLK
ncbi:MAG: hypothetical protein A3B30_02410 [Candidatus Komeilibacteria bacterium RIFCSPLOWO2_01_FULL_52_15]|uniref:Small-conductance mechanosensitive ion channel n=1 Tax=Candidatus Komeilibacteria bacterium RIFCSPLOWO2_01_FULL_52_15 TaxID=1798551 RepID=A0A1G2BRB7_9BACT|nr:MAG: hypothetical protein A3B30_02410 [Candidatus Komeilibacteria bacterium RIFCSPLOWO2_01_FULL_52_15]